MRSTENREFIRRLFHASIGIVVVTLYRLGITASQVLQVLIPLTIAWFIFDLGRLWLPSWQPSFYRVTGIILRPHEHRRLTSSFWFLLGTTLTLWCYREGVILVSLLSLCWADPMASWVGRRWGTRRLWNGKSLEGWLAAFITTTLITHSYLRTVDNMANALLAGFIAATVEACIIPGIDDNLLLPVITGFLLNNLTNLS